MDFKETMFDIAGKVGDFVDKGINKSKDSYNKMAEKNRIKKELTRLNTEVNNILSSVGRRLYNEERSNEKFAAVFGEVEMKETEISALKKQLRTIEGIVSCPECGEDMNKNDGQGAADAEIKDQNGYNHRQSPEACGPVRRKSKQRTREYPAVHWIIMLRFWRMLLPVSCSAL